MTPNRIDFEIQGKCIEVNDTIYRFEYGGLLSISSSNGANLHGSYSITKKGNRFYLKTEPGIFAGVKEVPIDIILNEKVILVNE